MLPWGSAMFPCESTLLFDADAFPWGVISFPPVGEFWYVTVSLCTSQTGLNVPTGNSHRLITFTQVLDKVTGDIS